MAQAFYFKVKEFVAGGTRIRYTYTVQLGSEVIVEGLSRAQAQAAVDEINDAAEARELAGMDADEAAAEANETAIRDAMDPGPFEVSDEEMDAMVSAWEVGRGW